MVQSHLLYKSESVCFPAVSQALKLHMASVSESLPLQLIPMELVGTDPVSCILLLPCGACCCCPTMTEISTASVLTRQSLPSQELQQMDETVLHECSHELNH